MARVLLIENAREFRRALVVALQAAGHTVHEAEDGKDGIESLKQHDYDLLITEVLLPELDGTAVINYVEGLPKAPRILAMSAGNEQIPAEMALLLAKTQATATLQLPADISEIVEMAGKLLKASGAAK